MNLGINNTSFQGYIRFQNKNGEEVKINTDNIKEIGEGNDEYTLIMKTKHDRGEYEIRHYDHKKGFENLLRVYDIASRNDVTLHINYSCDEKK